MSTTKAHKGYKGSIVIDRDICKGCLYCMEACPKKCLAVDEQLNRQGYYPVRLSEPDSCTGCGLCTVVCPDIAILVKHNKENVPEKA